jgi:hypothetical protein
LFSRRLRPSPNCLISAKPISPTIAAEVVWSESERDPLPLFVERQSEETCSVISVS